MPDMIVVAGPNGAGKTTFAAAIGQNGACYTDTAPCAPDNAGLAVALAGRQPARCPLFLATPAPMSPPCRNPAVKSRSVRRQRFLVPRGKA